ncbi:MAG TPA: hypothetical protein VKA77_10985 [Mycobacterium sp.]|nr:hypothetical protein [Mycobacterium sp.]
MIQPADIAAVVSRRAAMFGLAAFITAAPHANAQTTLAAESMTKPALMPSAAEINMMR